MAADADEFTYRSETGASILCGKPQGVLKLRLRRILTPENLEDAEVKMIANAFLSIKSIDGMRPLLNTPEHFETVMMRFANDDDLDMFMSQYQKLINPEAYDLLQSAALEGTEKGLTGEALNAFVIEKFRALQLARMQDVKF